MKGFVPTPQPIVDLMVEKLFHRRPPAADSTILDPGCGRGAFIDGVLRWCALHKQAAPSMVGVESDPAHAAYARNRFSDQASVTIAEK